MSDLVKPFKLILQCHMLIKSRREMFRISSNNLLSKRMRYSGTKSDKKHAFLIGKLGKGLLDLA